MKETPRIILDVFEDVEAVCARLEARITYFIQPWRARLDVVGIHEQVQDKQIEQVTACAVANQHDGALLQESALLSNACFTHQ